MILRRIFVTFISCGILYTNAALAVPGISFGYGPGTNDIRGYRVGLQRSWGTGITPQHRKITGYWELAFTQLHNPTEYSVPTNNNMEANSFSGVLRIPVKLCLQWYFDIGVGIAYLSNQEIGLRNLGTKWLFEDRLGAGLLLGQRLQYEIGYRLVHYSNAYLAQVNQSVNLHLLIVGYWFQ